jgi:aminopeptidase N
VAAVHEAHARAGNMTEEAGTLAILVEVGAADMALARFADRWARDAHVMDKWFALQSSLAPPDRALATATTLAAHPDFRWQNPNRFRALVGGFAANHAAFHRPEGYDWLAGWLIRLDGANPQTAARMSTAFETSGRFDAGRRAGAAAALNRILAAPGLSRDLGEMAGRMRAGLD